MTFVIISVKDGHHVIAIKYICMIQLVEVILHVIQWENYGQKHGIERIDVIIKKNVDGEWLGVIQVSRK